MDQLTTIEVTTSFVLRHDDDLNPAMLADLMAFTGGKLPTEQSLHNYIDALNDEDDEFAGEASAHFVKLLNVQFRGGQAKGTVVATEAVIA